MVSGNLDSPLSSIDKEHLHSQKLPADVAAAIFMFLSPDNKSKRHDYEWGCIYWVGSVLRIDVKKIS